MGMLYKMDGNFVTLEELSGCNLSVSNYLVIPVDIEYAPPCCRNNLLSGQHHVHQTEPVSHLKLFI